MRTKINRDSAMRIEINRDFLVEPCNALTLKVDDIPDAGDNYPICGVGQCIKTRWVNVSVALIKRLLRLGSFKTLSTGTYLKWIVQAAVGARVF